MQLCSKPYTYWIYWYWIVSGCPGRTLYNVLRTVHTEKCWVINQPEFIILPSKNIEYLSIQRNLIWGYNFSSECNTLLCNLRLELIVCELLWRILNQLNISKIASSGIQNTIPDVYFWFKRVFMDLMVFFCFSSLSISGWNYFKK